MSNSLRTTDIVDVLSMTDPMQIRCAEDRLFSGYDQAAARVSEHLSDGLLPLQALKKALRMYFGPDVMKGHDLSQACEQLERLLNIECAENQSDYWHEIDGHRYIEYHAIFADTGSMKVKARFDQGLAWIPEKRMRPAQLNSLIDPYTGSFVTKMAFDGHPFEI